MVTGLSVDDKSTVSLSGLSIQLASIHRLQVTAVNYSFTSIFVLKRVSSAMASFTIHLHDIKVTLLPTSQPSLPEDLRLIAKILVENDTTATSDESQIDPQGASWELKVKSNVPSERAFLIEISGLSPSRAVSFQFGSIEVDPAYIMASMGRVGRFSLDRPLSNLSNDLPSFQLRAGFTVDSITEVQTSTANNFPLDERSILSFLLAAKQEGVTVDLSDLNTFYESTQILQKTNRRRSLLLDLLGGAYLKHYRATQCVDDLHQAVKAYSKAEQDALWNDPRQNIYSARHGSALFYRFKRLGEVNDVHQAVLKLQKGVQLTPDGHPNKLTYFNNLGGSLIMRFEHLGDLGDLNSSILNYQNAVQLSPDNHPDKPLWFSNLGNSLLKRFEHLGELTDLNHSILNFQNAIQLTPDGHPNKPPMFNNLGKSHFKCFERFGELTDLKHSILNFQNAIQLTPDGHPDKPPMFSNIGISLLKRFEHLGDLADLNNSILNHQSAVQLTPDDHPDKLSWFTNLGISLTTRFERLGDLADLNSSILNHQNTVQLTPDGHPGKPLQFQNLGKSLHTRFERLGDLTDLNNSILNLQNAVRLTPEGHPDKSSQFSDLGNSLHTCFWHLGDLADLNNSILASQNAVQLTPEGHSNKPTFFNNLGISLFSRFEQLGDLTDLTSSIINQQNAVQLTPDGHPDKPLWSSSLGNSLLKRFEHLGDLSDLNNSILNYQNAMQLTPEDHPVKSSRFNNLGNSLLTRFGQLGDLTDLNSSILNQKNAVRLTPDGHPDKPSWFNNLGNSLHSRFERLGDLTDLTSSILNFQNAVGLTPDGHPDKPSWLSNLGISLIKHFEQLGDLADLISSIINLQNAMRLTPDGHPIKPSQFNNLGNSLLTRFGQLGDLTDLNSSILNLQSAVQLTPEGHPNKATFFDNLGISLFSRFVHLHNLDDIHKALSNFSLAACASSGSSSSRFAASRRWVRCHHILKSLPSAMLEAYHVTIDLLPQLAWLGSSVPERHHQLITAGDTVCEAAAAAVKAGCNGLAVEWLEQGRSVIWGQLLQLRTPLDFLKSRHPELGQRLELISLQLEGMESQQPAAHMVAEASRMPGSKSPQGELAKSSHDLAYEREDLLTKIRKQPGFEAFMLPKPLSQLAPAAHSGPIIMLSLSPVDNRCNALIVLPDLQDDVLSVPLESFTPDLAKQLYTALRQIVSPNEIRNTLENTSSQVSATPVIKNSENGFEDILEWLVKRTHDISLNDGMKRLGIELVPIGRKAPVTNHSTFEGILAELWHHVAKPVLDALVIKDSSSTPQLRLWWCPTGILSFLPFHAAGLYGPHAPTGSKLSEFVISSYTPTLTALLSASEDLTPPSEPQLLIVAETSSDGQIPLPGTRTERLLIEEQTRNCIKFNSLIGAKATPEHVVEGLKTASWVHFACHGVQHTSQPTESALLLAGNSKLTLKNLMQLNLSQRDMAFLSACQTATGDKKVPDEAVHLAAGMLAAGYRGVIATMWSVRDQVAPQVAREVYGHLFTGKGTPDPTEAAHALHHAISKLCEGSGRVDNEWFLSWVPFIHMGI